MPCFTFHIPFSILYPKLHISYTIFCAPYCILRINVSTARLRRRVRMDGHKLPNDVRKMMPAVGGSKVSGVEEALRCAKSASQVTLVCHSSLLDHPVWIPFGRHPAPHSAVRIQDHGGGRSTLTRARPKSEITVWSCLLVRFWNAFWTTFGPHVGHFSIKCVPIFSMQVWIHICINIAPSNNKKVAFCKLPDVLQT